ncbi:MAG: tetratricopeptide repeat protein, partial [Planctomycetes bacterium]|nr:tetratricopeptide repeat protein [Planctomycetota bacterium]
MPRLPFCPTLVLPRPALTGRVGLGLAAWFLVSPVLWAQQAAPPTNQPPAEQAPWQKVLNEADAHTVQRLTLALTKALENDKIPEAQRAANDILALRTRVQGPKHWQTIDAAQQLAEMKLLSRLKPADRTALTLSRTQLTRAEQLFGQRKFTEALAVAEQSRQTRARLLGEKHPDTARAQLQIANCRTWLKDYKPAQVAFLNAMGVLQTSLGEDHPDLATCMSDLAYCLSQQGNMDDAQLFFAKSLAIRRRVLGDLDPQTLLTCRIAATHLDRPGHYQRATELRTLAIELTQRQSGERHPDVADRRLDLARNLQSQRQTAEAQSQFEQALALRRDTLGDGAPPTISAFRELARHHYFYGNLLTAREILQTARAARLARDAAVDEELAGLEF